jgi:hypothetical protein
VAVSPTMGRTPTAIKKPAAPHNNRIIATLAVKVQQDQLSKGAGTFEPQ